MADKLAGKNKKAAPIPERLVLSPVEGAFRLRG
jgi:hypothetical protein